MLGSAVGISVGMLEEATNVETSVGVLVLVQGVAEICPDEPGTNVLLVEVGKAFEIDEV